MNTVSTLRPGLLVSLKTSVTGNVSYEKQDIEAERRLPNGSLRAQWETTKTVDNPEEHEEAIKTRSKCRSLITGICSKSNFGLLCPEDKAGLLWDRLTEAQSLAAEFNRRANLSKIEVYIIAGRVAQDDVSAVQAIRSEVRGLLDEMESGLTRLDVSAVREAANRAKSLGSMLSPDAQKRVQEAIDAARSAARKIVKAAESGVAEIDQATLTKIRQSRAGFLDLSETTAEVAIPEHSGRAIDLNPEEPPLPLEPTDEAFREEVAAAEGVSPADLTPVRKLGIADVLERVGAAPEAHGVLCGCPECSAEFGDTVSVPKRTVPAIEID